MALRTLLGSLVTAAALLSVPACGVAAPAPSVASGSPAAVAQSAASGSVVFSRAILTPGPTGETAYLSWTASKAIAGLRVDYQSAGGEVQSAVAERLPKTTKAASGTVKPRYRATLTGLRADTQYTYRIVSRSGQGLARQFTTPAAGTEPELDFLVFGDMQIDNATAGRAVVQAGLAAVPGAELVIQTGDGVNRPDRDKQWADMFTALGDGAGTRSWLMAIGNHELCVLTRCTSKSGQAFKSYYGRAPWDQAAQTWFTTDIGGVRFVVLDSFGGRVAEQAAFLDQALANNPNKWSVVVMHAGLYATRPGRTYPELRETWGPILEARKVDLVLSGHDHSYVRGIRTPGGPVYAGSVSGPKFYLTTWEDWTSNGAKVLVNVPETPTYTSVRVAGDRMDVQVVAAGTPGPLGEAAGTIVDQYSITHNNGEHVLK